MKKILFLTLLPLISQAQILENIIKKAEEKVNSTIGQVISPISQEEIGNGLKEALNKGIEKQVTKLTATDGFFKNELVKILLPDELKVVDEKLRQVGMSSLADKGLLVLNRAAEDAVKTSTPIFVDAIKKLTFQDAKNILLGEKNAATSYLQTQTTQALLAKFSPIIKKSLTKVGADKIWKQLISRYNALPTVKKVNPDLTGYTTNKAMDGVFKMISVEELEIRSKVDARTSETLKKVFALQDFR